MSKTWENFQVFLNIFNISNQGYLLQNSITKLLSSELSSKTKSLQVMNGKSSKTRVFFHNFSRPKRHFLKKRMSILFSLKSFWTLSIKKSCVNVLTQYFFYRFLLDYFSWNIAINFQCLKNPGRNRWNRHLCCTHILCYNRYFEQNLR